MAACRKWMFLLLLLPFFCGATTMPPVVTDVLVIGGGASGVAAGIQSARMGARTIIAEEETESGDLLIPIPIPLLERLGWKDGTNVEFGLD